MNTEIILQVPVFSDLANLALWLRREVFVAEQGVPEEEEYDSHDMKADVYVVVCHGSVVATLRVIHHANYSQISRFVVRRTERGRGIGGRLLAFVISDLRTKGKERVYLEAQADKLGFYKKHGFTPYGEEFLECGIVHLKMTNWGKT